MNYISHIKELVSGIIENETVTRDTETYDALTALYNHLESLEEVHKYMPYKDPGPVIQKLEQSLAKANTDLKHIRELYVKESTSNFKINQDLKNAQAEIQELTRTKDLYEVAKRKLLQFQSQIEDLNKENAYYRNTLDQKDQAVDDTIETFKKENQELQTQIENLEKKNRDLRSQLKEVNEYYHNLNKGEE